MCQCKKMLSGALCLLVVFGAVNWGLVGMFRLDLVALLFGKMSPSSRAVYILIGLAAVFKIIAVLKRHCCCSSSSCSLKKK